MEYVEGKLPMDNQRQFDIPLTTQFHYSIPTSQKGRLTNEDYVYFDIFDLNPVDYTVAVEGYNGNIRNVDNLREKVQLPHVRFGSDAFIMLLPNNNTLPVFIGILKRGKRYKVSVYNKTYKGHFLLQ